MKKQRTIYIIILYCVLILFSIIFLFPLFSMITKSLMALSEVRELPPLLFPKTPQFVTYIKIFTYAGYFNGIPYMLVYLKNTLVLVLLVGVGTLFSSSLCAFGFSKIEFPGRDILFFITLATMMIPSVVTMIPLYIIFTNLKWIDHLYPLWVPMWFGGGAMAIFLVKQYMRTIPDVLIESAKIDGANYWQQYSKIVLPNCRPILSVLAISCFLGPWNDLMGPLLYLNSKEKWTLSLGITNMGMGAIGQVEGLTYIMAACTMMIIVPVILFLFGQKYFINSVILTGIKG